MPQVFTQNKKIKVIQYGDISSQEFSFRQIAKRMYFVVVGFMSR
jgi:hypothetical protein